MSNSTAITLGLSPTSVEGSGIVPDVTLITAHGNQTFGQRVDILDIRVDAVGQPIVLVVRRAGNKKERQSIPWHEVIRLIDREAE